MAFKSGGHSRPQYSISTSIFVRKGKYIKGPSFGLWDADSGPMARGSVKDSYLEELSEFIAKAAKREMSVSFALFKNKKKQNDEDDESEYGSKRREEEEEEDDKPKRTKKPRREEPEEEEDEKPAKKSSKKSGGKKDWDFDDDDD